MSTALRFHVGPAAAFKDHSRQLVKCGSRNVTVYKYGGQFYALDNACYHHGGPLLEGEIEEMGGHPCVVCPWHQYRIALDTGEGLYWTLPMSPSGKPDKSKKRTVASKGLKQRTHVVTVEDGEVFVTVKTAGQRIASDEYAEMSLANREETMKQPLCIRKNSSGCGINRGIHSNLRSGQVFTGTAAEAKVARDAFSHSCVLICSRVEHVCDKTKEFFFDLFSGHINANFLVPGQFVDLQLPVPAPAAKRFIRRWTVIETNNDKCLFTLIVKAAEHSRGGSAWMLSNALHQRFSLVRFGGSFTLTHHMNRLREVDGRVVMLSAGIGITPSYASLRHHIESERRATVPKLNIVHLHVDRTVSSVVRLEQFVKWHYTNADHFSYRFHCYLTKQQELAPGMEKGDLLKPLLTYNLRPDAKEIGERLGGFVSESSPALVFVSGPPGFVSMSRLALLSHGVLESDLLTDEELP